MLRELRSILIVLGGITVGSIAAAQQPMALPQPSQTGSNSFVSDRSNVIYLVFDGALYRNLNNESDGWDQIASGIRAVAIDSQHENLFYGIDSQDHVVKSLNAGKSWITLNLGVPANVHPTCVYVNPASSDEVFVGTSEGLMKSTDAGFSWRATSLTGALLQIAINPKSPLVQYALVSGTIFISADAGVTWKKSETGLPTEIVRGQGRTASTVPIKISAIVPVNLGSSFLLATTKGKGVFRSDDNGASWKNSGIGLPAGETFHTATLRPDSVVIASNESIFRSSDGTHWQSWPIKLSGLAFSLDSLEGVIGHPNRDGLLINFRFPRDWTTTHNLGYVDPNGTLIGLNYGVLQHSDVESIWSGARDGRSALFAFTANLHFTDQTKQNTRPITFSDSLDGGYSWAINGTVKDCGTRALVRKDDPKTMYIYGRAGCLMKSEDGGRLWERLPGFNGGAGNAEVTKIEPDPTDRNVLYYSVGVNEREVFRYQYDAAAKNGQSIDLKVRGADVIVAEDNNKMLFTAAGQLSTDGGWTWTDKSPPLSKYMPDIKGGYIKPITLVSFRGATLRLLVGQFDRMSHNSAIIVLKSDDMGSTWQPVTSIPNYKLVTVFRNPNDSTNIFVSAVVFSKGQFSDSPSMVRVLESKNGGDSWNEIYSVKPTMKLNTSAAMSGDAQAELVRTVTQVQRERGRTLLVGGSDGLWKSDDEGKTWKRLGGVQ